jgi:hypothetical protein
VDQILDPFGRLHRFAEDATLRAPQRARKEKWVRFVFQMLLGRQPHNRKRPSPKLNVPRRSCSTRRCAFRARKHSHHDLEDC